MNDSADADGTTPAAAGSDFAGELRVALGAIQRRLRRQSNVADLTRTQMNVLGRIERDGPTTATSLAQAEGVRQQSMGAAVAALEAEGLIAGSPHPTDGRKTVLSLTDHAREMYTVGRLAREDWLAQAIESELNAAERAQLADATRLLARLAQLP